MRSCASVARRCSTSRSRSRVRDATAPRNCPTQIRAISVSPANKDTPMASGVCQRVGPGGRQRNTNPSSEARGQARRLGVDLRHPLEPPGVDMADGHHVRDHQRRHLLRFGEELAAAQATLGASRQRQDVVDELVPVGHGVLPAPQAGPPERIHRFGVALDERRRGEQDVVVEIDAVVAGPDDVRFDSQRAQDGRLDRAVG